MSSLVVYGPHWSAYTRTVRLVLFEKAIPYDLVEVDFSSGTMPEQHLQRHPFAKVPVIDHDGFWLYETAAICRYINVAFDGADLEPNTHQGVGRMAQIIAILDNYLSAEIRMGFVNEAHIKPMLGIHSELQRVAEAKAAILKGFDALAMCCDASSKANGFMVGGALSLADLHAMPLFDFLGAVDGGDALIDSQPILRGWWQAISERPALLSTAVDLKIFETLS